MKIQSVGGRRAVAAALGLALAGTTSALSTGSAQSAPVAGDCAAPFPVADLAAGDPVDGLTVSRGTVPEAFTGEVIGVIEGGIAPGLDMVMAEMTSTAIDKVGGIWAGMSGSPVYADDGRLIGAVAYGLAGTTPVAGITPFEAMDDYFDAGAPARVRVNERQARAIAKATDVTRAQARGGFSQLPMDAGLSGLSAQRLRKLKRKGPEHLGLEGVRASGTASSTAAAGPETLVAGGNLGAAFSYGDITIGGVGTVTSVCDDELVGFGHPFSWTGKTTLGMMPADAVYVQEDRAWVPFKVANMGAPAGTIDQDRLSGISGDLGALPEETDVTSTVTYGSRNRTGTSHSLAPEYNAGVAFSQILANHDRVVDAITGGSETNSVSISGTDAQDAPFAIAFGDRYTSRWDISFESTFDTADIVWALSRMDGVKVDDVDSVADVDDSTATWRVAGVQQRMGRTWVNLGRRMPAVAKPGGRMRIRAILNSGEQVRRVPVTVAVPRDVRRRGGALQVVGGASSWMRGLSKVKTPDALAEKLAAQVRNDEVEVSLHFFKRGRNTVVSEVSEPQTRVVRGGKWVEMVVVRR